MLRRPDGRVLLVDQPYVQGWSLPGGDLKRGEDLRTGLRRELREELGLELDVPEPVLARQRPHDRWITFVALLPVSDEQADAATPASAELRAVEWFLPAGLPPVDGDAAGPLRLILATEVSKRHQA